MPRIDINCDLAEGTSDDEIARDVSLMQFISSANICGGAYAGDRRSLATCVAAAVEQCVAIGAHPGFADPEHFGRRPLEMAPRPLRELVWRQLETVAVCAANHGGSLAYVKPHGALYHLVGQSAKWADDFSAAVAAFDARLMIYGLSGSELLAAAGRCGLVGVAEVYIDRNYTVDSGGTVSLVPRERSEAVVTDPDAAGQRILSILRTGLVRTVEGRDVSVRAETACLHSDHPGSLAFAEQVCARLVAAGVAIAPPLQDA
jgi:UPF0271 protein